MKPKCKKTSSQRWFNQATRLSLVGAIAAAFNPAAAVEITGSFSGFWNQIEHQNHGVILQVARQAAGNKVGVAYWALYDESGNPTWLYAQGPIEGNTLNATLYNVEGVTFLQPAEPGVNLVNPVGTLQIEFTDCNSGDVSYASPQVIVGTGGFKIQRITTQPGTNCSGGIGDDIAPGTTPETFDIDLISTGVYPNASGDVEFELFPGDAELDIEVEDLPVGSYTVQIGGIPRGTIEVRQGDDGTEGELDFSAPLDDDDDLLLDFDPRGQVIDILEGGTIVLTTIAPDQGNPPGAGGGNPTTFGDDDIDIDLTNAGIYPAGEADADLDIENDGARAEFEVEIEDVPVGQYTLVVGGVERGQIQVVMGDDETEGEIEFAFPASPGSLLLDFDPRDQLIEVFEDSTRIFFADFPPVGDDDDGDGNDDGGSDDDDDDGNDDGGSDDDDGNDDGGDDDGGSTTSDISVELNNTGVFSDGSARADYDFDSDGASFDVRVDDIPAGSYDLVVDGQVRGQIVVETDDDADGDGDISFSNPLEDDDLLLDFDPRGTLVEIFDGETRLFFIEFPQE